MLRKLFFCFTFLQLFSCAQEKYENLHVSIETQFGKIHVALFPDKAPKSVAAFLSFVDQGLYKNSSFYRVLKEENQPSSSFKSELIQGGIWETNNKKANTLKGTPHETTKQTGILHTNGTISLARTTPGTASSEFFICIGTQPSYDFGNSANPDGQGYAAFGKVVKGMDVLKKIHQQPENGEAFYPSVKIFNIIRL
ncbi:MAG: peptidylprolyl isomerase [Chitinophagaceae bacterium]|nr:peptidylprolyl isomerase [Chitinophagaceae bacterium]